MTLRTLLAQPHYPPLVGVVVVLGTFAESTAASPALWRPLVVAAVVGLFLQGVGGLATRDRHLGALLGATALLALVGQLAAALLASATLMGYTAWLIRARRRLASVSWYTATRLANAITMITLVLASAAASSAWVELKAPLLEIPALRSDGDSPDIYLILLDGHPRLDTIESEFGYDSSGFKQEMTRQGFDLSPRSRSNYNLTVLTLPSLLSMATADELVPEPPADPVEQYRDLARHLNSSRAIAALKAVGYEIVSLPSPFSNATLYDADRVLSSNGFSEFELDLLTKGALRRVLPDVQREVIGDSHRSRIEFTLESLTALSRQSDGPPRVVLAHLMAPHPPYVFDAEGKNSGPQDCYPVSCGFWTQEWDPPNDLGRVLLDQVVYIDQAVAETTSEMLQRSRRPPVVIVFSDHGHRHDPGNTAEALRTLFLANTPGAPGLFPEDVTPLQVMPMIFNQYFGTKLPIRQGDSFYIDQRRLQLTGPFDMTMVPTMEVNP